MRNFIFVLVLILAGSIIFQPEIAFGQEKTSAKSNPPRLIRYSKPTKKKAKKRKMKRKIDLSKVPQLIRPTR